MNADSSPTSPENEEPSEAPLAAEGKLLPLPDVGDLLFLGIMQILLFQRPDYMFQDASVGWHLVTGKWIFENHAIPHADLFSYTFPDKGWVAYEWLFDLIAYMLTLAGGLNLLAVAVATMISFVFIKVYDRTRSDGGPLGLAVPITIIGIFASAIHWLARPHIVTLVCVYFYLKKLEDFYRGTISSTRILIYIGLLMLLWVNCHPAFAMGIALIGIYFLGAGIRWIRAVDAEKTKYLAITKTLFLAGVVACLATLCNPYGLELHQYILEYLKGSTVLANTDEFRSPVFKGDDIHALCLEVLIAFLFGGLAISKRQISLPYFTTTLLFMHLALSAVRNIPIFSIVSVPAIGLLFSSTRLQDSTRPLADAFPKFKEKIERIARPFREFAQQEMLCKMRILPILYVSFVTIVALLGGSIAGTKILNAGFSEIEMPNKTLAYLKEHKLPYDHGFNFDNWGGLLRYKLDTRVFIDDRADFYGEKFYTQYGAIIQANPGWQKLLDDLKIDWILMPKNTKLTLELKTAPGWKLACEDDGDYGASLFIRAGKEP